MFIFKCPVCLDKFQYRGRNRKYCSRKCMGKDPERKATLSINGKTNKGKIHIRQPSEKCPFYTITSTGYKMLRKRLHPTADKRGYIMEHRWVMEQHLGRFLDPKEKIHHLNGNRLDNRISNLHLCTSQSEHIKKHRNPLNGKFEIIHSS